MLLLSLVSALFPAVARAGDLEDRFATVWESLWAETGTPTSVIRWQGEIRVRFTGPNVERYREHALGALRDATQAAGLSLRDVSAEDNAAEAANLEFRTVEEGVLGNTIACTTSFLRIARGYVDKVLIRAFGRNAWTCTHHEVMHALGIRGHPSGRTVLSYFPPRRDQLMDMDILMLKAWYSPQMRPGATPFEALKVMTDAVIEAAVAESEKEVARAAQAAYLRDRLLEMERYARGEGEVPTIVFRSGRGTEKAMADGRVLMAFHIGTAYFRGIGAPASVPQGLQWVERAAAGGNAAARIMLDARRKATAAEQ